MTILPAADLTLKKLGLGVRVNREGFGTLGLAIDIVGQFHFAFILSHST